MVVAAIAESGQRVGENCVAAASNAAAKQTFANSGQRMA